MKNKFILLLFCSIIFSCSKKESKEDIKNIYNITPNDSIEDTNCLKYKNYLDSLSYNTRIKIPLEAVKCKLLKKDNLSKYNYAEILLKHNYNNYNIFLYRLNCIAGGDCGDYYISVLDINYEIIDKKLLLKEIAEGENNTTANDFKFSNEKLTFRILFEKFDEEKGEYVENMQDKAYSISSLGMIIEQYNE